MGFVDISDGMNELCFGNAVCIDYISLDLDERLSFFLLQRVPFTKTIIEGL